jgi:hypothetical protein
LKDFLRVVKIEGLLIVIYVTISTAVMVNETDNEIIYIKTNPLCVEETSTIREKHDDGDSELRGIHLRDSTGDKIGSNQLDDMEQG